MTEEKVKKRWYKRWWAILLFIIFGFSFIVNIADYNSNYSVDKNVEKNSVPLQAPEVKTYTLGEPVQASDLKWRITNFSTATQIGQNLMGTFMGEKADGVFIIVDVEVENTGKRAKYLTDTFLKLVDDQGREFLPNSMAAIYLKPEGSALVFETINPGIFMKGKIVFDVPVGLKVANVKISSSFMDNSFYTIQLMS